MRSKSSALLPKKPKEVFNTNTNIESGYVCSIGDLPNQCKESISKYQGSCTAIAVGEEHLAAISTRGELTIEGNNNFGQLGTANNNAITNRLDFGEAVSKVWCTPYSTFAETCNHTLYGFGMNNRGQLGLGHSNKVNKPTVISKFS